MKKPKTFKVITFGCRTNQAESRMLGEQIIKKLGKVAQVAKVEKADIVIINTCAVTGKAEKEVRQMTRKVKRENPRCFLVVTGCWAEKVQGLRSKLQGSIDLVVGSEDKLSISDILKKQFSNETMKQFSNETIYEDKYFKHKKALIKIQDGCDNFCTYCIVPYLRGRSVSRPANEIVEEVNGKVEQGVREVVLTGIDIASYRFKVKGEKVKSRGDDREGSDLVRLLELIFAETEIKKISFGSINLNVFNNEFINYLFAICHTPRAICHFHIPLQSGCNVTLKRMNRKYTIEEYKKAINKLREKISGITFSTDVMVGFPGETKEEFTESLRNIKKIGFSKIHVFRYSVRERTAAAGAAKEWGEINEKVKRERARRMREGNKV